MYKRKSDIQTLSLMKLHKALLILTLSLLFGSCGKDNAFDLFQGSGPIVKEQRDLSGFFDKISLFNNVNLVLSQGPNTSITVEGGNNLLSDITTEIGEDSTLTIRNLNKYNWVRSYEKEITVYLQINKLRKIRYDSSADITTIDTIRQDSLWVEAWGGSGTIKMAVDCGTLWIIQHYGSMDFVISGKSGVTALYAASYGPLHCQNLRSDDTYITSDGTNDCYINANIWIDAHINSLGNIYYTGNPGKVTKAGTGSGKLIHVE